MIAPLPLDASDDTAFLWLDELIVSTNTALAGVRAVDNRRQWLLMRLLPARAPIDNLSRISSPRPDLIAGWQSFGLWWKDTYLTRHPDIALRNAMSAISEAHIFAAWDFGNEFVVWRMLQDGQRQYFSEIFNDPHVGPYVSAQLDTVRQLSNETGVWWMSNSSRDLVQVPLEEWKRIYADHETKRINRLGGRSSI